MIISTIDHNNIKFKVVSLNVRGIHTFEKRKANFNWFIKQNADMCFSYKKLIAQR